MRYVGTRGVNQWTEVNYNERNLIENGFIDEFRLAMANLPANNAAGGTRAGSFAYFGPGSGTNPLPIYLAYLNGRADAANAAAYSGANWTNSTFAGRLGQGLPRSERVGRPISTATPPAAPARSPCGLPANLFVVNPAVGNVNVYESEAFSDYHALQIELKRRLVATACRSTAATSTPTSAARRPRRAFRPGAGAHRQRAARHQDAVELRDPVRPRPAIRLEHAPAPRMP